MNSGSMRGSAGSVFVSEFGAAPSTFEASFCDADVVVCLSPSPPLVVPAPKPAICLFACSLREIVATTGTTPSVAPPRPPLEPAFAAARASATVSGGFTGDVINTYRPHNVLVSNTCDFGTAAAACGIRFPAKVTPGGTRPGKAVGRETGFGLLILRKRIYWLLYYWLCCIDVAMLVVCPQHHCQNFDSVVVVPRRWTT